jgi:23S rRNA (uracil1939-C5)-methyltransferase
MLPPWSRASARFDSEGKAVVLLESEEGSEGKEHRRLAKTTKETTRPSVVSGVLADGVPLGGRRELVHRVRGKELVTDAASFFQGSEEGAEELVRVTAEMLGSDRRGQLLDLYAGSGLFAVGVGDRFDRVVASDAEERAVRMLRRNLERHGIPGEARAEEAQVTLRKAPPASDETVIVDPPRTGMEKVVRKTLVERRPERIVAVSCDPATGARDAAELLEAGYRLERIAALDLFPVTAHVETVALLRREAGAPERPGAPRL